MPQDIENECKRILNDAQIDINGLVIDSLYADKFLDGLQGLQKRKILNKDTFAALYSLCQRTENVKNLDNYIYHLSKGLMRLHEGLLLNKANIDILSLYSQHADIIADAFCALHNAGIPLNKDNLNIIPYQNAKQIEILAKVWHFFHEKRIPLTHDIFIALCENVPTADLHTNNGVSILYKAGILTPDNMKSLCHYAQYAEVLANGMRILHSAGILNVFKNITSFENILLLLGLAKLEKAEYIGLATIPTSKKIYHSIISSKTEQFNKYVKIAAFFMAHHQTLNKVINTQEINTLLLEVQPESVAHDLKKIFYKLGGYSFMPDDEKNITLGVEIEYSNITVYYKPLTEFTMSIIQKGWSHPGDASVRQIGENAYGGEATTPILANNVDLLSAMLNIAFLEAMGGKTNASCGLHVHIGVNNIVTPVEYKQLEIEIIDDVAQPYTNYQFEFIKQFLKIYIREANKFSTIERDLNAFSKPVTLSVAEIKDSDTLSDLIKKVNLYNRDYEINLRAFLKHGTIEIRRFSGTIEEPHIYATLSMVAAMTKEAKMRTDHVFKSNLAMPEEKTTPLSVIDKDQQPLTSSQLLFFKQQQTECQTELFTLRVKSVNECNLIITTEGNAELKLDPKVKTKNTVCIYLSQDNDIVYYFFDKKGNNKPRGFIEGNKFKNIIQKLNVGEELNQREKNQILFEVSRQAPLLISHRVEKAKSDPLFIPFAPR